MQTAIAITVTPRIITAIITPTPIMIDSVVLSSSDVLSVGSEGAKEESAY